MIETIIEDERTEREREQTIGYWVATDRDMGQWRSEIVGQRVRSLIAVPVVSTDDADQVKARLDARDEMLRVRWQEHDQPTPHLNRGDHLHIYNTTHSFRYALEGDTE